MGMKLKSPGTDRATDPLAMQIRKHLAHACPYPTAFRHVDVENVNGVIRLRGRVASFYLKQMLQTYVGKLEGVKQIDNVVEVQPG